MHLKLLKVSKLHMHAQQWHLFIKQDEFYIKYNVVNMHMDESSGDVIISLQA